MEMLSEDEFLEHFGKKGMRWGVTNADKLTGRTSGAKEKPTSDPAKVYSEQAVRIKSELKKLGHTELDEAVLKAKYETPAGADPTKGLSDKQKLALKIGAGVVIGGALAYATYKAYGLGNNLVSLETTKTNAYFGAADGLKINWDTPVKLPKGSVIKRISTVAETEIRPGGFFGCFRDEDVQSYSAILPTFWQQWGVGNPLKGGFINHYKAGAAVAAPSGKETLEMFKSFVDSSPEFRANLGMAHFKPGEISDLKGYSGMFSDFTMGWIKGDTPNNKVFFDAVKDKGYNALIDFNDAGKLGKTPLRVIDSSIFTIVKNEPLKLKDMVEAAKNWTPSLVHVMSRFITNKRNTMTNNNRPGMLSEDEFLEHADAINTMTEDEYLEHFGKKGMKWGQRKAAAGASAVGGAVKRQGSAIKKNHELNSASRKNDTAARNASIDTARNNVKSGLNKAAIKDAKNAYKSDKKEIGSREAKKILSSVKHKNLNDRELGDKMKSGRESVNMVLFGRSPKASVSGGGFVTSYSSNRFK